MYFTREEMLALEAVAIAMFESFLRQQATEGRGKSVQDWQDIDKQDRDSWRAAARNMLSEVWDR